MPTHRSRPKLGIFFTHPTQHHSVMFNLLADNPEIDVSIYYFDPGAWKGMHDTGYNLANVWDVDLSHKRARVLWNPIRGPHIVHQRQFNPAIPFLMLVKQFDFVFIASYSAPSAWMALVFGKITGAKILYQSDTNILNEVRKERRPFVRWIIRAFVRGASHLLAVGNLNKESHLLNGADERKISFCPYPVDVKRLRMRISVPAAEEERIEIRRKFGIGPNTCVFVFCGKLIPRKRPLDFLRALAKLKNRDVLGLVVGSGELSAEVQAEIDRGAPAKLVGFVNQHAIPVYFSVGHVGVVCSDYDPHPLVCTEMASCGLGLIVSRFCGVWGADDIVLPDANGLVYECGDIDALSTAMSRLLTNPVERKKFGDASVARALTQDAAVAAGKIAKIVLPGRRD